MQSGVMKMAQLGKRIQKCPQCKALTDEDCKAKEDETCYYSSILTETPDPTPGPDPYPDDTYRLENQCYCSVRGYIPCWNSIIDNANI